MLSDFGKDGFGFVYFFVFGDEFVEQIFALVNIDIDGEVIEASVDGGGLSCLVLEDEAAVLDGAVLKLRVDFDESAEG